MSDYSFVLYNRPRLDERQMLRRAHDFCEMMSQRRSVRDFSPDPVPRELIELAIATASSAPSGAHRQPWRFVAVSEANTKLRIRAAAEQEEYQSHEGGRLPVEWHEALKPFAVSWRKSYLEIVPWIVVVFEETYGVEPAGTTKKNYYVKESVGIACGLFIAALHNMGLVTLPHTPSPMAFLSEILGRPPNERPYVMFPVGYPADGAKVPDLTRKSLDETAIWNV